MSFNKKHFSIINSGKKILHKVRGKWVAIAVSLLVMLGVAGATSSVSADTNINTNNPEVVKQQENQENQNNTNAQEISKTGVKHADDFYDGLFAGNAKYANSDKVPSYVKKIDPISARWGNIMNRFVHSGDYIMIPKDHLQHASALFKQYLDNDVFNSNARQSYLNYENYADLHGYTSSISGNISSYIKAPVINDTKGLVNVAPETDKNNINNYTPEDKLALTNVTAQTTFGNGGGSHVEHRVPGTGNMINISTNDTLAPYAGKYYAPIYYLNSKDLTHVNPYGTYDGGKGTLEGIPLDYIMAVRPQVYDKDGNLLSNDLVKYAMSTGNKIRYNFDHEDVIPNSTPNDDVDNNIPTYGQPISDPADEDVIPKHPIVIKHASVQNNTPSENTPAVDHDSDNNKPVNKNSDNNQPINHDPNNGKPVNSHPDNHEDVIVSQPTTPTNNVPTYGQPVSNDNTKDVVAHK